MSFLLITCSPAIHYAKTTELNLKTESTLETFWQPVGYSYHAIWPSKSVILYSNESLLVLVISVCIEGAFSCMEVDVLGRELVFREWWINASCKTITIHRNRWSFITVKWKRKQKIDTFKNGELSEFLKAPQLK